MTVDELIAALQKLSAEGHGSAPAVVSAGDPGDEREQNVCGVRVRSWTPNIGPRGVNGTREKRYEVVIDGAP